MTANRRDLVYYKIRKRNISCETEHFVETHLCKLRTILLIYMRVAFRRHVSMAA